MRTQIAARGWVTRSSKTLHQLCGNEDIDYHLLSDAVPVFDNRLAVLDDAQTALEAVLPLEDLENDIEAADDFREKARFPPLHATRLLEEHNTPTAEGSDSVGPSLVSSHVGVEAKLPKLQMPSFSGDVKEWKGFWEQFQAAVGNTELPEVTKFSYLSRLYRSYLCLLRITRSLAICYISASADRNESYSRISRVC